MPLLNSLSLKPLSPQWGIGPPITQQCSQNLSELGSQQEILRGQFLRSLEIFLAVNNNMQLIALKRLRENCVLVDANHRKAVEIILNSENISRQQDQEIYSFICWRMVNFMKVDLQARLSKRMGIV